MTKPFDSEKLHVLIIEPYCGGSHELFIDGLTGHLPFQFALLTLPARKWKWRMRLSAPYFAQRLNETERRFDRILCSTFIDVATFRSLAPKWVRDVPVLTYFHENQFDYPVQKEDERDFHFGLTNMTTALASDSLAFNSGYNLRSFLDGIESTMKHSYDLQLGNIVDIIKAKARILPFAVDFDEIDASPEVPRRDSPVIIWNHRWEHDKNPELFFETLFELDEEGLAFKLIVLGQSFKDSPGIFDLAAERLKHRIIQFGYPSTRSEYVQWLRHGDIVVSTSNHEFFGISVLEAVRAGCRPLLPNRLSYPELYPDEYLHGNDNFKSELREVISEGQRLSQEQSRQLTERFTWKSLYSAYEEWIINAQVSLR